MNTAKPSKVLRKGGLRERAEMAAGLTGTSDDRREDGAEPLGHELRVHEIELEMQADELRRAHEDLEVSRDKYRELFDFAPVGYVTLDAQGCIVEANLTAEALLGLDRERLLGRSLARFVLPADIAAFHQHQRAVRGSSSRQVCEVRMARSDGSVVELSIESAAALGEPGHSWSVLIDVTQRKLAERSAVEGTERLARMNRVLVAEMTERERIQRKLEDREALRRETELALDRERGFADRLIEVAPALVLMLGSDGRILKFNSYMSDITGYSLEEVVGRDWCTVFVPEVARASAREAVARGVTSSTGARGQLVPIMTKACAIRDIEWSHTTFQNDLGETVGVVAIGQDVTDRKRIEQDLRQAHKMEAVGVLASGVAHDFNNVLMGIIGCADLALNRLSHQDHARSYVEQMKAAALGGSSVINRLMAFARRQQTERKVLDLNSLVARMDTMLRHLLGEDVELSTSLTAGNAAISCQPDEIEQLVMNLSVNARQAMPKGGRLTLSTHEVSLSEDDGCARGLSGGRYVVLEVADTGSGMDEHTRQRIFEPFFTTKRAGNGTGLGLSMVYATVQEHSGQIEVDSAPGLGSRFSIYFPQSSEAPARPSVAPDAPLGAQSGGETVLLVEDEPLVRLSVSHYLERHGYTVLEATNDREVMKILEEHSGPIDVLLSDTVLPGRSGPEIAPLVRAARPAVRIVYMSAHPNETLIAEGRIAPGTPTLQKPFTESALISRIRVALSDDVIHIPPPGKLFTEATSRIWRPRLLLVEDQDAARSASSELLDELGYEVLAVPTGGAALAACREHSDAFDVVVTDVGLPDFSGVEVARRIRLLLRGVGIVFLSGRSGDDSALTQMLDEANTAFVQKPIEISRLARTIDMVLAGTHRARSLRSGLS